MSDRDDREARAMLAALRWLEGGREDDPAAEPAAAEEETEADGTLRRLHVEALGLLPYAEEPVAPSAGARERLLAALPAQREGAEVRSIERARRPSAVAAEVPAAASERPDGAGRSDRDGRSERPWKWSAALAAALFAAAVGLAGWLWMELDRTRSTLVDVQTERTELTDLVARQEEQLRRSAGFEELISATTTAGVEICPLRPVGDPAMRPEAFAVLYMPPASEEWYLVASNLTAETRGVYRVWLDTPDGALPVGRLDARREGSTLEFVPPRAIQERPDRMLSIAVTLESEGDVSSPRGPMVLFGDEKMTVS